MNSTFVTVTVLLTIAYLASRYKLNPTEEHEFGEPNNVDRYRHDGTQPIEQKVSNRLDADYPNVDEIHDKLTSASVLS